MTRARLSYGLLTSQNQGGGDSKQGQVSRVGKSGVIFRLISRKSTPTEVNEPVEEDAYITFAETTNGGSAYSFNSDNTRICGYYINNVLRTFPIVWDATTGANLGIPFAETTNGGAAYSFNSNNTRICGFYFDVSSNQFPIVWDATTGAKIAPNTFAETITNGGGAFGFNSDLVNTRICGYYNDNSYKSFPIVWDATTGLQAAPNTFAETTTNGGAAYSFNSDNTRICGFYRDGSGKQFPIVWDATNGNKIAGITFAETTYGGIAIGFNSNNTRICGVYRNNSSKPFPIVWDAATGNRI